MFIIDLSPTDWLDSHFIFKYFLIVFLLIYQIVFPFILRMRMHVIINISVVDAEWYTK